jgi:hypothetical protein
VFFPGNPAAVTGVNPRFRPAALRPCLSAGLPFSEDIPFCSMVYFAMFFLFPACFGKFLRKNFGLFS